MNPTVIFDFDGVIINSEPLHFKADEIVFAENNIRISKSEHLAFIGTSDREMWSAIIKQTAICLRLENLLYQKEKALFQIIHELPDLPLMEGLPPLLEDLKTNGVTLAIASSSAKSFILPILKRINIEHFFSEVVTANDVHSAKPAPDLYLKACALTGAKPEKTVAIEDSKNGILSARAANLKVIGLEHPYPFNQDLTMATYRVSSLKELDYNFLSEILADY